MNLSFSILRLTLGVTQIVIQDEDKRNVWFSAWN